MALRQRDDDVAGTSPPNRRGLRWIAAAGAVAGAVFYSNWLLETVFTRTLPDPDLYISELAAADQPYGEWFRAGDLSAAIVLVVAAVAALLSRPGSRWSVNGWWAVVVFAAATALDNTVWMLVCAPSSNPTCAAREAAQTVPIGHQLHWLSSGVVLAAAMASLLAFAIADRHEDAPPKVRRLGLFMLTALPGTAILTGLAMLLDRADHVGVIGIAQRAELTAFAGWLIYIALRTAPCQAGQSE